MSVAKSLGSGIHLIMKLQDLQIDFRKEEFVVLALNGPPNVLIKVLVKQVLKLSLNFQPKYKRENFIVKP